MHHQLSHARLRDAKGRFVKQPKPAPLPPDVMRELLAIVIPLEPRSILDETYVAQVSPEFWHGAGTRAEPPGIAPE